MNLKEAFRYQSFITRLSTEASMLLGSNETIVSVTEHHMLSEASPELQDKTVEKQRPVFDPDPAKIITLMEKLIETRETLTTAIAEAKYYCYRNLDALLETNKMRKVLASALQTAIKMPRAETEVNATGYKFNNEGNQTPFTYKVKRVPVPRIEISQLKAKNSEVRKKADETSTDIDQIMVNTTVDFDPPFDINSTLEEILTSMD